MANKLRLATRGSALALAQAHIVSELLCAHGIETEIVTVSTKGDKDQTSPLTKIGGNGLFSKQIEEYLLQNLADIAVHSAKDLSTDTDSRLIIAATPEADSHYDVLLTLKNSPETDRPIIGTSSPRRACQIKELIPGCEIKEIRGNVDTRLSKLKNGEYDAIILAQAGLNRLACDLSDFNVNVLDAFVPAAGQGIIAVQCRSNDTETVEMLKKISHEPTMKRLTLERRELKKLNVSCSDPIGIYYDGVKVSTYRG